MVIDQHAVQNHNIMMCNKSFERVEHSRYLGPTITNKSCIQEEIKSRLDAGNACYNWAQNLMSSSLLSKYKDKDIQSCNFACCFVWCETWPLTLREARRLRMFQNRVLRKIFGPKRDEVTGECTKSVL